MWSDEIGEALSQRSIEIEKEDEKDTETSANKTTMDCVV